MPRPKSIIPTYRLHKATGQAVVYVNRREVYLGLHGSPESQEAYAALLERLRHGLGGKLPKKRECRQPAFALNDLFLRFVSDELPKYSNAEQRCIRGAIRIARELFGPTPPSEFGPLKLRTVRDAMIGKGWSRSYINKQVKRLRKILRWGVGWEMVPQTVVDSLSAVSSLEFGDSDAPEGTPRTAVSDERIKAVRPFLDERYRDMLDLMLLTGCRPGELLNLKIGQIDRSGEIWRVALSKHKTAHQGKSRTLFFNASAQLILRKYLKADPDAKLFPGARGDRFSDAMRRACEEAFQMPAELRSRRRHRLTPALEAKAKAWHQEHSFSPHWLRHTVATRLADEVGLEAAQRLLGHSQKAMTEHYSRAAEKQAIDAVKRLG